VTHELLKPRILIIARDVRIQRLISNCLDEEYVTDLTSSGSLAYLLLKDYRYAAIITSLDLPNKHGGLGIVAALRAWLGRIHVPIIGIGAASFRREHPDWIDAGLTEIVATPVTADTLNKALLRATRLRQCA
jgi:PleD family two-component response regulator